MEDGLDETFLVGNRYAVLYSLSVASARRGRGIGTRLLDLVDHELERRSTRRGRAWVSAFGLAQIVSM